MTIRVLRKALINQIAAGEVIENPAGVVKELVENACDSGATRIEIRYVGNGVERIIVQDNGCGIPADELVLAVTRHATSKITDISDLQKIHTLGFRGEALASIASVSRCGITSKPATQETAYCVTVNAETSDPTIMPAAHPGGTTVVVEDLFYNTPVRRKFLRSEKTESQHIEKAVERIALSHFSIDFTLWADGKKLWHLPIAKNMEERKNRIYKLLGKRFIDAAIPIDFKQGYLHLTGWAAAPAHFRRQPDQQYIFVQDRWVKDKIISHAVNRAYQPYLMGPDYPSYVLYLHLPPEAFDVNIHPTKQEVRFLDQRAVHDFIETRIDDVLRKWKKPTEDPPSTVNRRFSVEIPLLTMVCQDVGYLPPYRLIQVDARLMVVDLIKASRALLSKDLNNPQVSSVPLAVIKRWQCDSIEAALRVKQLEPMLLALGFRLNICCAESVVEILVVPPVLLPVPDLPAFLTAWISALPEHVNRETLVQTALRFAPPHIAGALSAEAIVPYLQTWKEEHIAVELTAEMLSTVC